MAEQEERAKRPDREQIDRIRFEIDNVHQIHGDTCLCGFKSSRSRSRTEHLTALFAEAVLDLEPEAREEPSAAAKADAETLARVMAKVYEPDLDWDNPAEYDLLDRETLTDSARRILERMKWSGLTFWHLDDLVLDEFDPAPRPAPEIPDAEVAAAYSAFVQASFGFPGVPAMRAALEAARDA